MNVAMVRVLDAPAVADKEYSYFIPPDMRERVGVGTFVHAPFGKSNREKLGVVTALRVEENFLRPLKALNGVKEDGTLALTPSQLAICDFLREQTLCATGEAIRCLLPKGALGQIRVGYKATFDKLPEGLEGTYNRRAIEVMEILSQKKVLQSQIGCTLEELQKHFNGKDCRKLLKVLIEDGLVCACQSVKSAGKKTVERVFLTDRSLAQAALAGKLRGEKQVSLLQTLLEEDGILLSELKEKYGSIAPTLKTLQGKGLITIESTVTDRTPESRPLRQSEEPLTDEQKAAVEQLLSLYESGSPKAALLFGVTGSGKTRVMTEVIRAVLKSGKQVIFLVPEISLTPQTVGIYRALFGERVAILHSALSEGERLDAYDRIREGDADICIGTRSAVFAPFENLGLIVMDEEQEHTYKSDSAPRYHARDVARFRCAAVNGKALLLLASATPSFESYEKAKQGIYTLVRLKNRCGRAKLPQTVIDDLRGESTPGVISPFGDLLLGEIAEALRKKEQSILFVGRRGYHHVLSCTLCGDAITCPNCSVALTYHSTGALRRRGADEGYSPTLPGYLLCHYCGCRIPLPKECPNCGSGALRFLGYGTQFAEKELSLRFPEARILRMDADSTSTKLAYERMLGDFRDGKYDILLGTQMVTKGHDFPNVTLVGVLLADTGLYSDDFRSGEKTFSLLTQVIGRAGRSEKAGRAVIQTYSPDHPTLLAAAKQDYEGFFENEIAMRKAMQFPPYCDIALFTLQSADEILLQKGAARFEELLRERHRGNYRDVFVRCFGPFEAPIYKLQGKCRMRFLVKCRANRRTREYLRDILLYFTEKAGDKVTVTLDLNPGAT